MAYIRHRSRHVRKSVYSDLRTVLEKMRWIDDSATPDLLGILQGNPINLVDSWPDEAAFHAQKIPPNTLALDPGNPGLLLEYELGGRYSQEYVFSLMLLARNDAIAQAVLQDLQDRYEGFSSREQLMDAWADIDMDDVEPGYIQLYEWPTLESEQPVEIVRMEVEHFRYAKSAEQNFPGNEVYYAELAIVDYLGG